MSKIVGFLKWPLGFIVLLIAGLYLSGYGYIVKAVSMTYLSGKKSAAIDNYKGFDNRIVLSGRHLPWSESQKYNDFEMPERLKKEHEDFESIAYLVIQNDEVVYEEYWDSYNNKSLSNSFSMAKSIVTILMQVAIQEGKIKSLDQAVGDYFPEFNNTELSKKLTVGDLSRMSSGLNWEESYSNPFSVTTRAYFGEDLEEIILGLKVVEEPGKEYKYLSGNTQLLAMIIEKATGQKLSDYASEKLWKPMGASSDALWMIDKAGGLEKAYCCFNSNARDFARFGKLWLNKGNWNGKQLIDTSFVDLSVKPVFKNTQFYGYSWWLDYSSFDTDVYFMRGILGQYVIVVPEYDLVIVRLGHKRDGKDEGKPHPRDFYVYVEETLKMLDLN
jgi:CubicO group peptidase (beta-lactamase class C family)